MTLENMVLVIGGTLTGLLAGLLYAFSVAIVPALRDLKAREHLAAMQFINIRIKNPVFFLSFLGPSLLLPLAAFLHRGAAPFPWLVGAAVLHILGSNGVTIAGNIPLNDNLDKIDVGTLSDAEAERIREAFQGRGTPWMRLHMIRTLAATLATALVFIACLSKIVSN